MKRWMKQVVAVLLALGVLGVFMVTMWLAGRGLEYLDALLF